MANVGGAYLSTSIIQGLSSMMTLFTVSYKFKIKRDIKKNKQWGAKKSFFLQIWHIKIVCTFYQ